LRRVRRSIAVAPWRPSNSSRESAMVSMEK
jgi:hypothetical protein